MFSQRCLSLNFCPNLAVREKFFSISAPDVLNCPIVLVIIFMFVAGAAPKNTIDIWGDFVSDVFTIVFVSDTLFVGLDGSLFKVRCTDVFLYTDSLIIGAVLESPLELSGDVFDSGLSVITSANMYPFRSSCMSHSELAMRSVTLVERVVGTSHANFFHLSFCLGFFVYLRVCVWA